MQPFRAREEVTTHVAAGRKEGGRREGGRGLILCKTCIHTHAYDLYLTGIIILAISESECLGPLCYYI